MNWGDYRRQRDLIVSTFELSPSERRRLRECMDRIRRQALNEALDWLDEEAKAICLTRDAARKSWGMG